MGITAAVPKYHRLGEGFNKREHLKAMEHSGRRTKAHGYQSAASWITEKTDGRKGILLCKWCDHKFNPKRNKYRKRFVPDPSGVTSGFMANGMCNDCKQPTVNCGGGTFYVAEELWAKVSMDPAEARRRWRQRQRMGEELSLLRKITQSNSSRRQPSARLNITDKRRIRP
ncbi:hypothetical protein CMI37_07260 [Candidatus Pacearchaeota archaeon]|nr:hypothetical protein [Candidatus Pacearchaeota archaeon]